MNPDLQMFIVKKLYLAGVDPLILNKKKKLPSKCVSRNFPEIAEYMKQQGIDDNHLMRIIFLIKYKPYINLFIYLNLYLTIRGKKSTKETRTTEANQTT